MKHFTKAAESLHITQSALSQRIKNLEDDLGVTLIVRDRSGLRMTEEGEELLRYCQTKVQIEEQVIEKIKNTQSYRLHGVIRIGGFSSVMSSVALPVLSQLIKENPGIRIRMVTKELYELRSLLKSGEIDFMILDERIEQDNIITKLLGYEENVLVKKKGSGVPQVYLDHDEEDKVTIRHLKKQSDKAIVRQYLDDVYGIVEGVKLGLGYAVVPKHLIKKEKDLEIIDPSKTMKVPLILHYYEQPIYSELHRAVVSCLVENCTKFL